MNNCVIANYSCVYVHERVFVSQHSGDHGD